MVNELRVACEYLDIFLEQLHGLSDWEIEFVIDLVPNFPNL